LTFEPKYVTLKSGGNSSDQLFAFACAASNPAYGRTIETLVTAAERIARKGKLELNHGTLARVAYITSSFFETKGKFEEEIEQKTQVAFVVGHFSERNRLPT
jgi:hypothetical protein